MIYECLHEDSVDTLWLTCTILDSFSSPDRMYVRYKLGRETKEEWVTHDKVRIVMSGCEPSY